MSFAYISDHSVLTIIHKVGVFIIPFTEEVAEAQT